MKHFVRILAALSIFFATGANTSLAETTVTCGMTLHEDVSLQEDMTCSGNALKIGADGITLDLNGHSIIGDGSDTAIINYGYADVTIKNGFVNGFDTGVLLFTAHENIINYLSVDADIVGIWLFGGSSSRIARNVTSDSEAVGIFIDNRGGTVRDNIIEFNVVRGNGVGIWFLGGQDNMIRRNLAEGNDSGYFIGYYGANENTFTGNVGRNNAWDGLWVPDDRNIIEKNAFIENGSIGMNISGDENYVHRNIAKGNGSFDIHNGGIDNSYSQNICDTSSGPPVDCGSSPYNQTSSLRIEDANGLPILPPLP